MTVWSRLAALLVPRPPIPDAATPPPPGKDRLHLFFGQFRTEANARAYCYASADEMHPVQLTIDLPGAFVDPAHVTVAFGPDVRPQLERWFDPGLVEDMMLHIHSADTLVALAEAAFGGLPYSLNNTPRLTYLGHYLVDR